MVITAAAAAAVEELPLSLAALIIDNNVIEYEILPRLPAKSICRFRCVSKRWNSFLSTRMFANMQLLQHHINNPKKTYKLLLIDKPAVDKNLCCKPLNHGSVTVGFNTLKEACPIFDLLLASLDGLVCVASTKSFINSSLALWNPLTDAYYKLPSNPNFTCPYDSKKDVIGFYSDSSNDYKLLYWVSSGAYIYSQRLNSWRKIEIFVENYDDYYLHEICSWSRATFCGHCLYFSVIELSTEDQCIICFDVNTEDFRVIQLPPLPSGARYYCHAKLVVIDGCIHLCVVYYAQFKHGSMWKLNGDDGTWEEVAFFSRSPYSVLVNHSMLHREVCMTRNARDDWLAISERGPRDSPNFEIMNMEEFTLTDLSWPEYTYSRIIYNETLVSPIPPSVS